MAEADPRTREPDRNRFGRDHRAEERLTAARTAEELAQHLARLSVRLRHGAETPAETDAMIAEVHACRLPSTRSEAAEETSHLAALRRDYVLPLGALAAAWSDAVAHAEGDREAIVAVARTLRALRRAFWPAKPLAEIEGEEVEDPTTRHPRCLGVLNELGRTARAFLGGDDVVAAKKEFAVWLEARFAEQMREPFFCWARPGKELKPNAHARVRDRLTEQERESVAKTLADELLDALEHGYALTEVRADLPSDFASADRRASVAAVIMEHLKKHFDPGSEIGDEAPARRTARKALSAALRAVGYTKVDTLIDSLTR